MISVAAVRAFLVGRGVTAPIFAGFEEQSTPDRLVYVTPTGGLGEARERRFERVTIQCRCRGEQEDPADAEALADQVDRAWMDAIYPIVVGDRHCISVQWAGGPPQILARDNARRWESSCSYVCELER